MARSRPSVAVKVFRLGLALEGGALPGVGREVAGQPKSVAGGG
ncbi:hypothetical protein [Nonomuraea guangzhouensis]|nr:hypothetical protein [Nonomuraea guangzhouensis]